MKKLTDFVFIVTNIQSDTKLTSIDIQDMQERMKINESAN